MTDAVPVAPTPPAAAPSDGKTLGIIGLVLAFLFALAGLIVSLIARSQSKKAGVKNTPATAGLILSIIFLVLQLVWAIVVIGGFISLGAACADLGPGTHVTDSGATITCG